MLTALAHGFLGLAAFVTVLALAGFRFSGSDQDVPSTDIGLD
jgi:hypothetical protein